MKNTYFQLINQTYYFPQEGFDLNQGSLTFHGISLMYLIEKYGTPFRLTYLPRIGDQIKKAKNFFNKAIKANNYKGEYHYCYCTKCCHFSHVIEEALEHTVHLETSSSFDIDIIRILEAKGKINKQTILIQNGHKTEDYLNKIVSLMDDGFENVIPVLDSKFELDRFYAKTKGELTVGIRMAINEEPQSAYYTSRLGIRSAEIIDYYKTKIAKKKRVKLKMLHFFVDSGIKDNLYYWGEFRKALKLFAELKKICPTLDSINLGGGLPIRNNLGFEYDYKYMINELVRNIKEVCQEEGIDEPDIYTEFGKYTVGESGAIIFSVLEQKQQNDSELWYLIDNSLMNTIPDAWSIFEKFILLPVNKWDNEYSRVSIGGISCDHSDYYNSEDLNQEIFLPTYESDKEEPLYLGFFHTGAYQDAISGYGGIKHCLIPSPKQVIIDRDDKGNIVDRLYRDEQTVEQMLKILGY
ncbi:MAG TPA: arginine decarboxylase [Saprospiraceae bacterium]|jgi:arginine decarboxylase|nr:arginine decarboxylase [Saprospiraceae bacterium]MBK6667030.1 arginine decarboxylase [Saprospiraceae bacterium]MBK7697642.1 arginine decarboxylase [Saprospiraceae bacterium]MBK8885649.1 arginine decarboxylase [Saprospiraceae bacterium]MBK9584042.1 arginine decarboxylase [Saprospiraceae bacterium]